ncbi:MAG TPA: 3-deoxy-D-manno-octulosonic acid transferase [Pyrinomonadaceae bacterium]|nr:3-deoxy-D-manno-octulosonic acid transferase [Pyrinomonadaceae bacterium]
MYLLYSLLLTVGFVAMLPWFAIDAFRTRKYITGLRQRLGKLPAIASDERPLIWLHCVSVGETEAARPLVRALLDRFPSYRLVISTTTVTGQRIARNAFGRDAAAVFYFPIDWAWTVRRVLRTLQPAAVLIMETELWPHLLRECRRRAIPVALINGRISITSFGRYQMIRPFIRGVLNNLSIALMQSEQDAARIRELGIAGERVLMPGNLKFDSAESSTDNDTTANLRERFGFDRSTRLIVAASTHAPEELVVIDAFKQIRNSQPGYQTRLLIAPRHPERFAEVASLLQASGLTWSRRSAAAQAEDRISDVVLLDTIGELRCVYPLADVAFVGGSIATHGGHNVLEAAARGVCVVTGPHTHNFAAVTKAMLDEIAIVQLPQVSASAASAELANALNTLLSNDTLRRDIGQRALMVCDRNRGATEQTLHMIADLLEKPNTIGEPIPFPALSVTAAK